MFRKGLVCAALLSASMTALSADLAKDYDPAESRCQFWDDSGLARLTAQLDYADEVLPNIPPEEDRYLTAEDAAAQKIYREELEKNDWKAPTQGQANMRYAALEARPLYTVWGVRKQLVKAKAAIAEILKPAPGFAAYRKNQNAEHLEHAISALYPVSSYALHMQELLTKQSLVSNSRMFTTDQYSRLYSTALTLPSDIGYYMSCKLAKIMGRQSFQ